MAFILNLNYLHFFQFYFPIISYFLYLSFIRLFISLFLIVNHAQAFVSLSVAYLKGKSLIAAGN